MFTVVNTPSLFLVFPTVFTVVNTLSLFLVFPAVFTVVNTRLLLVPLLLFAAPAPVAGSCGSYLPQCSCYCFRCSYLIPCSCSCFRCFCLPVLFLLPLLLLLFAALLLFLSYRAIKLMILVVLIWQINCQFRAASRPRRGVTWSTLASLPPHWRG